MLLPDSRRINRSTTSCLQGLTRNKRFFIGNAQCQTWREVRNGSLRFPILEVVNRKEQCIHVIIAWCSEGKCMKYDMNPRGTLPSWSLLHLYLPQHPPESARQRPVFWCFFLPRSSRRIWHVLWWVCYGSLILTEESDLKTTNPLKQIETLKILFRDKPPPGNPQETDFLRAAGKDKDFPGATAVTPRASKHQGSISTAPMAACIASCGGDGHLPKFR